MIPILMQDETTVGFLKEAMSCVVTEERNGVFELTLTYPVTGALFDKLQIDRFVKAKPNDTADLQLFRIYEVTKPMNGVVTVKPDKIITTENGLTIKQKIIPDSLLAPKDVASWIKKGQKMKPCAKLNNGTGKPRGLVVHNTGDIKVASGTNAAEQYTRATYNGNMSGVVVHFYVWDTEIWQNLREDERGWHAADGSTRRSSQRKDGSTLGGNLDTIAIECIGDRKLSEDTTAKLVAWLCKKHGLDPKTDVYTHKYFYPRKNCPAYILPHWNTFLSAVQKYYNALTGKAITPKTETASRTHTVKHGDTLWQIAQTYLGKGSRYTEIVKLSGLKSNVLYTGQVLTLPEKKIRTYRTRQVRFNRLT